MNLEQFAEKAGVILIRCDKKWGGTWGYKTKDNPKSSMNGFRTKRSALNNWLKNTFGKRCSKAVLSLLAVEKNYIYSWGSKPKEVE